MIVIKVYENYWSNNIIFQEYLKQGVEIKNELGSFDTATFIIQDYMLHRWEKVEIYEAGTPDKLIFRWYVADIEKQATVLMETCTVTCWDWKWLLQERWVLYWFEAVSTPLNTIVEDMMNLWNAMWDHWTYDIDYTTPIDMTADLGSTCYNIIDELANEVWWYWSVDQWKIIISPLIWEDKTFWSNKMEFFFDWTNASNIKEIKETQAESRANVAIWISNDWSKLMVYDQEEVPYWVVIENFQTWDLEEKTAALLNKNNVDKRSLSVELDTNKTYNVNVWDKVILRIEWLRTIEDYNWPVYVVSKTTNYKFWKRYETVELSDVATTSQTLPWLIKKINDKIDKIRNR